MKRAWNAHPLLSQWDWLHDQYVVQDKSLQQIADDLGVWLLTVHNWRKKHGIPARPRGYSERFHGRSGRYITRGYAHIYVPDHPAGHKGFVPEHRDVMERHIGRHLTRDEIIHHRNGDRLDNRIENLELMHSPGEHRSVHTIEEQPKRRLLRDKAWLTRQLAAGRSFGEIAAMAGCKSGVSVLKWARKFGLSSNRKNQYS